MKLPPPPKKIPVWASLLQAARPSVRRAALKQPKVETSAPREAEQKVAAPPPTKAGAKPPPTINVIPENGVWPDGIPPVMGAHLMASGEETRCPFPQPSPCCSRLAG